MTSPSDVCGRCESALERGDLRCALCGESAAVKTQPRTEAEVRVLRCDGCGAAVKYDPKVQAPHCDFCGSITRLESVEDPMEQTELFLPFTVDAGSASAALRRWLGTLGWFRPSDLRSAARMQSLRPLWWVSWVFDATALVSWSADSDFDSRRSDWAPHSGQVVLNFDDIAVSASRGLSDEETAALAPGYDLSTAVESLKDLRNATIEQFDVQRSFARMRIVESIEQIAGARLLEGVIPGNVCRNVHVAPLLRGLITRRCGLPAYVLAYRYGGKLYRAVICGQDTSRVVGSAPYSLAKILAIPAVILGLTLLAYALGLL